MEYLLATLYSTAVLRLLIHTALPNKGCIRHYEGREEGDYFTCG